jgi:protein SCO1/2
MRSIHPFFRTLKPGSGLSVRLFVMLFGAVAAAVPTPLSPVRPAAAPDSAPGKPSGYSSPEDLRSLIDQEGRPFSFARLRKKTVLVNFIFTSCPMKCPAQTQALVHLQRELPPAMRSRVEFVSLTVDPQRDSASVLKRYATALGADLSGWAFVTGKEAELNWLYRYFSVGVSAIAGGQYDHQMGAYLLDAGGRVMQRYTGDIDKPRLLREIGEIDSLNK